MAVPPACAARVLAAGGRCGIIVPNGVLFGDGVGVRIKERLLSDCNLHTIVRLPPGVFAPYTSIPTNLLFFDKTGRTKETWYYELPLPEGRKSFSKTKPLRFEEFATCQEWWGGAGRKRRKETEQAWRVSIADVEANGFNLDLRNPNRPDDLAHRPPLELITEMVKAEKEILALLSEIECRARGPMTSRYRVRRLGDVLAIERDEVPVDAEATYQIAGMYSFGRGVFTRAAIFGADTSYKSLFRLHAGSLIMSRLNAWESAVAMVGPEHDGWFVSNEYPTFSVDRDKAEPSYLSATSVDGQSIGMRSETVPAAWVAMWEHADFGYIQRR